MHEVVMFGKCLGDDVVLRILAMLRKRELCLCEIRDVLGIDRHRADDRLRKLRRMGLVKVRARGNWLVYRLGGKYADLIETLFEAFEESTAWDPVLVRDAQEVEVRVTCRTEDWCLRRSRETAAEGSGERPKDAPGNED